MRPILSWSQILENKKICDQPNLVTNRFENLKKSMKNPQKTKTWLNQLFQKFFTLKLSLLNSTPGNASPIPDYAAPTSDKDMPKLSLDPSSFRALVRSRLYSLSL